MVIYKITNAIDGNVYVGQTTKSAEERFKEHCWDALSGRLDTALAKAIRKYGPDCFYVDVVEEVGDGGDLSEREAYWIKWYDSCNSGYNMTAGGEGGNTYANKTSEEMDEICDKIRQSKLGKKNPNHRKVKCRNLMTHEELHFDTVTQCREYFGESHNSFCSNRCNHKLSFPFRGEWLFSFEDEPYPSDYSMVKRNRKSRKVFITDLETNLSGFFPSYAEAERYFGLQPKALSGKASRHKENRFVMRNRYDITIIE